MPEENPDTEVNVYTLTELWEGDLNNEISKYAKTFALDRLKRRRLNDKELGQEVTLILRRINLTAASAESDFRNHLFKVIERQHMGKAYIELPIDAQFSLDGGKISDTSSAPLLCIFSKEGNMMHLLFSLSLDLSSLSPETKRDIIWAQEVENLKSSTKRSLEGSPEFAYSYLLRFDMEKRQLCLTLKVTATPTEEWTARSIQRTVGIWWRLFAEAFPDGKPEVENISPITPRSFYMSTYVPDKTEAIPDSVQHPALSCELLRYQRRTVRWMMNKEGADLQDVMTKKNVPEGLNEDAGTNNTSTVVGGEGLVEPNKCTNPGDTNNSPDTSKDEILGGLPPTFFKAIDKEGRKCYVSHILGIVSMNLPALRREMNKGVPRGGILAEEMGLGKTVELIALMALNPMPQMSHDDHNIGSTLIITPPSILEQWKKEIRKHAPGVKVFHYLGMKSSRSHRSEDLIDQFREHDVILTTYSVLSSEIHYAKLPPKRDMRMWKRYGVKKSPLVDICWWRVCLDEAQMVDGGFSNAAVCARLIPRVNAWAVTGTPIRKDINDLHGLLRFLKYEPFCAKDKGIFNRLTRFNHAAFRSLFKSITLRHTKDIVSDEIALPSQKRVIVTVPFSAVEEQNYRHLFQQMCDDCGVNESGVPHEGNTNPDFDTLDKMRIWLTRLRQTCLHPQAGERNRKIFGGHKGPLRTVEEVLSVMIDQHMVSTHNDERSLFQSMIKRGQVHEHQGNIGEALRVWKNVLVEVQKVVRECRDALAQEAGYQTKPARLGITKASKSTPLDWSEEEEEDTVEDDKSSRIGVLKNRLRGFLDLEHGCLFWVATAYYQLKGQEAQKDPKSEKIMEFQTLEDEYYHQAKLVRKQIMNETQSRALKLVSVLREKANNQGFVDTPDINDLSAKGGIESRGFIDDIMVLISFLNEQAVILDEWRESLIQLLIKPMMDEDEDQELKGDEFEITVTDQEVAERIMTALRGLIADREEALTGVVNSLVKSDLDTDLGRPGAGQDMLRQMVAVKESLKPKEVIGHLRAHITALRNVASNLKMKEESGNTRAKMERIFVEAEMKKGQDILASQIKINNNLTREVELFRNATNARKLYHQQLQTISDTVSPLDLGGIPKLDRGYFEKVLKEEEKMAERITKAKSKWRYLIHLKGQGVEESPECGICKCPYEIGVLTSCGHAFCKECMKIWHQQSHKCPACATNLNSRDIYDISYKPKEATMQEEQTTSASDNSSPLTPGIYADMDDRLLKEIKRVDINQYYGSKIDMIVRHLLWLKQNEPGFKAVIFSQWSDFLDFMKSVLTQAKVGFTSLEKKNGLQKFKEDLDCHCFFLHAKSQSSGLTLVNATHVFLCEPLINVTLELQAISRVHRIGQTRPTTVWLYVINGTVEQSVLELATRRRTALIEGYRSSEGEEHAEGVSSLPPDHKLDAANSMELQKGSVKLVEKSLGGGEVVGNDDLWGCLFGAGKSSPHPKEGDKAVRREVLAGAAERRIGVEIRRKRGKSAIP